MSLMDFLTGRDIERTYNRMQHTIESIKRGTDREYRAAVWLATMLHDKHYPEREWMPAPNTLEVLAQIARMADGLVRRRD